MKYEEILKLLDAGYSKEEIISMDGNDHADDGNDHADDGNEHVDDRNEHADDRNEHADDITNAVNEMKQMFSDFTKELTALNIMNSHQMGDEKTGVDDIIANIISPTLNKKGD